MITASDLRAWHSEARQLRRSLPLLAETTDSVQLALVRDLLAAVLEFERMLRRLDRRLFGGAVHG
jgi:hypothetical protein